MPNGSARWFPAARHAFLQTLKAEACLRLAGLCGLELA